MQFHFLCGLRDDVQQQQDNFLAPHAGPSPVMPTPPPPCCGRSCNATAGQLEGAPHRPVARHAHDAAAAVLRPVLQKDNSTLAWTY
jgi:hypothetical protein